MPPSDANSSAGKTPSTSPAVAYTRGHPLAASALGLAIVAGGVIGFSLFAEVLTPPRSVFGAHVRASGVASWS